jgi:hypothetical protein
LINQDIEILLLLRLILLLLRLAWILLRGIWESLRAILISLRGDRRIARPQGRASRRHPSIDRSRIRPWTNAQAVSSRSPASGDSPSPSSKRSQHSMNARGGDRPSARAYTSSTASGASAWVVGRGDVSSHNLGKREGRRRALAGVEKEREIGAVEVERVLDLQLEVLDCAHLRPRGPRLVGTRNPSQFLLDLAQDFQQVGMIRTATHNPLDHAAFSSHYSPRASTS